MPRPAKDDPRDCFKTFRFTEAELKRLEARARASRQNLSAYVRRLLLEVTDQDIAARQEPPNAPQPARRDPSALVLAEQIRRVGVNLNQIARRMNEQRLPPPRELSGVLEEIRSYVRRVREP